MKILMTSDTYLPRLGGGEYHVHYVLSELRKMGHSVTLVTIEPMPVTEPDSSYVLRAKADLASLPRLILLLWRETGRVDLVHAHYSYRLTFLAALIAFVRRKPFVVTQHGLGLLPQAYSSTFHAVIFKMWRWTSMAVASRVISTSDDLSVTIRELGFGKKIILIPNGYDPARFTAMPQTDASKPRLLTVRRLVPKTGIQYLIQVLPEVRKAFPAVHVDIVGDGRLRDSLEAQAIALGVRDAVTFHGAVSHEKVLEFFFAASIVVFPSTAESTSLACIEAMALQRVIVASRVGGLIELLGSHEERGYLVPITVSEHSDYDAAAALPTDAAKRLAEKVIHALSSTAEAQAKAALAARYAKDHFGWPKLVEQTVNEVFLPLVG